MIIIFIFKQTPLNEALRRNHRNIIELLLKKGAKTDLYEITHDGQKCYPMDIANEAQKSLIFRYSNKNVLHGKNIFML